MTAALSSTTSSSVSCSESKRDSAIACRDAPFERSTCAIDYEQPREPPIAWLAAEWDGEELKVECRTTSGTVLAPHVEVTAARSNSGKRMATRWPSDVRVCTKLSWSEGAGVPVLIAVETREGHVRQAAVHDVRPTADADVLCGEFDEELLREALDHLLEERYGYFPNAGSDGAGGNGPGAGVILGGADYSVPAYVDARRRFQLVDNWRKELRDSDERSRPFILNDGRRIRERWSAVAKSGADRGLRLAAQVAVDELKRRIRRFA